MKTAIGRVVRIAIFGGLVMSLLFAALVLHPLPATWKFLHPDYLSVSEVCRRWGEWPLDIAEFRSAEEDNSTRAAMACSLLKTRDSYVGMDRLEIAPLFGNLTGYYHTELRPTYLIEVAKSKSQDTWQIVFLIDRNRTLSEVFVHKNCC